MNILFICTHNRCRSILCEAITNDFNDPRIKAYSAGSQPAGVVHPLSLKYLAARGIATNNLRSQSWDDFADIDIAITVCDSAAGESCPLWLGNSPKVHWGLSDPSKLEGSESELEAAFNTCIDSIQARIKALLALDIESLSKTDLIAALKQIHQDVNGSAS
ncbi:Arsenate reductase [Zhongshania aliphaticivorans]|uniref:Arsenate reductase n=1 Tax=Zhongshania aliphaticivorans TaxID=1470434 RepID=A0A5S9N9E5_9GAMM|nr:arsenate reductase ArsC [Zhongshania aliphaticivorans]CAA0080506.1 Arsenate reductase [Zhongshania aliphaticivorans]CAA0085702.1 Arsenate reductase [Zhongshania aliphaticivorans]